MWGYTAASNQKTFAAPNFIDAMPYNGNDDEDDGDGNFTIVIVVLSSVVRIQAYDKYGR